MDKTVVELFAGVGGFRVGLNHIDSIDENGKAIEYGPWKFVWANQWEPSTKVQHAFDCYYMRFASGDESKDSLEFSNVDISKVDKKSIPNHTLLTGGFPCQDYSVARSLKDEKGIEGKKGVLWWQIHEILKIKNPKFILLENVDRLLKAPAKQRGQAFGIILRCLSDDGYGVQWRVINAAEYGHPQRRRRTFIFAFHKSTKYYHRFNETITKYSHEQVLVDDMMFSKPFPCYKKEKTHFNEIGLSQKEFPELVDVSNGFKFNFLNAGCCMNHHVITCDVVSDYHGVIQTLGDCLDVDYVPDFCYRLDFEKFKYLKGAKKLNRKAKNGHRYVYSEGPIAFPDYLDKPGRTMLTSEGTVNRSTHYILDPKTDKYRILTPVECERLNEFPDGWTDSGMPEKKRYFMMGNALVTGLVRTMGDEIDKIIDEEE